MSSGRSRGQRPQDETEQDFYHSDYRYPERRGARRRPYPPRPPRRKRRIWPFLLAGCGLGILVTVLSAAVVVFLTIRASQNNGLSFGGMANNRTFTSESNTTVPLSSITQMQICNKIGNVSVKVDPTASSITVQSKKTVSATSEAAASSEFGRMAVEIQPPGNIVNPLNCARLQTASTPTLPTIPTTTNTPTLTGPGPATSSALTVNVTMPDNNGLFQANRDSVDIAVTLPQSVLPSNNTPMQLDVEDPVGNITIDGINGTLNLKGNTGNIDVKHTILADGSHIETGQGNITFAGLVEISTHATQPFRYYIQSEQGTINISLSGNPNINLDANTNVGAITSDFALGVNNNGGPVSYNGPLNPAVGNPVGANIVLDVSTGNINISKSPV